MSSAVIYALRLAAKLPPDTASALMSRVTATANGPFAVQLVLHAEPNEYQPQGFGVAFNPMHAAFVCSD